MYPLDWIEQAELEDHGDANGVDDCREFGGLEPGLNQLSGRYLR
jgi:hypothetical protein